LANLLQTSENWTAALDEGFGLDVIYLDYRKAFDSVPIKRLIEKLRSYGIGGRLLRWIEDFLTSRTMRVGLRGALSKLVEVLSGSVVSVLYFISVSISVFVNGIVFQFPFYFRFLGYFRFRFRFVFVCPLSLPFQFVICITSINMVYITPPALL